MVVPFNLTQVEFDGYTDDGNMFLFMSDLVGTRLPRRTCDPSHSDEAEFMPFLPGIPFNPHGRLGPKV